jgi:DNA-binding NtrC family response regulator
MNKTDIDIASDLDNPDCFIPTKLADLEKAAIINALKFHNGNKTKVAESLGITIKTIYNRIEHYQIDTSSLNKCTTKS